jgi:hypothetical protein
MSSAPKNMLALTKPGLCPDLQRAEWSRVVLRAFGLIDEAGLADGRQDLAAFVSDELVVHAKSQDDARAKVQAIQDVLARDMPQWRFTYKAYVLESLKNQASDECQSSGDWRFGNGYARVCLFTGKTSYKCLTRAEPSNGSSAPFG